MTTIQDVEKFWQCHPLFSGESKFEAGSKEFFEEHGRVYIEDCFAGSAAKKDMCIPAGLPKDAKILDLGCGIGFWTVELLTTGGYANVYAADLTRRGLDLTKKRLDLYGLTATLAVQNAERLTYGDGFFDHVNCLGVIHHTPDTESAIREVARVLKRGGTAHISVYYRNVFVRAWPAMSRLGRILRKCGGGLKGRGRESILLQTNPGEITRLYDGANNPIGKCYTKKEIAAMAAPYFTVQKVFFNYFPARALPLRLPKFIHRFLSDNFGFMIHLCLRRK